MRSSRKICGSATLELVLNVEEIKESITVGNGKSMMMNKVGSLKFWVT
jgi:hypothetical protein